MEYIVMMTGLDAECQRQNVDHIPDSKDPGVHIDLDIGPTRKRRIDVLIDVDPFASDRCLNHCRPERLYHLREAIHQTLRRNGFRQTPRL